VCVVHIDTTCVCVYQTERAIEEWHTKASLAAQDLCERDAHIMEIKKLSRTKHRHNRSSKNMRTPGGLAQLSVGVGFFSRAV
jgi:hypothetical protein